MCNSLKVPGSTSRALLHAKPENGGIGLKDIREEQNGAFLHSFIKNRLNYDGNTIAKDILTQRLRDKPKYNHFLCFGTDCPKKPTDKMLSQLDSISTGCMLLKYFQYTPLSPQPAGHLMRQYNISQEMNDWLKHRKVYSMLEIDVNSMERRKIKTEFHKWVVPVQLKEEMHRQVILEKTHNNNATQTKRRYLFQSKNDAAKPYGLISRADNVRFIRKQITDEEIETEFIVLEKNNKKEVHIWTDGSKIESKDADGNVINKLGSAFYTGHITTSKSFTPFVATSAAGAELEAILAALITAPLHYNTHI